MVLAHMGSQSPLCRGEEGGINLWMEERNNASGSRGGLSQFEGYDQDVTSLHSPGVHVKVATVLLAIFLRSSNGDAPSIVVVVVCHRCTIEVLHQFWGILVASCSSGSALGARGDTVALCTVTPGARGDVRGCKR